MEETDYRIQTSKIEDVDSIFDLYKSISRSTGGLARVEGEITKEYVYNFTKKSIKNGIQLIVIDLKKDNQVIAEIHSYKLDPFVFSHVLSELTIAVHPDYQNQKLGRKLFQALLDFVKDKRSDILRVELIARESNTRAINLYESLGFLKEGRLERRINNGGKNYEADIPMAWFNPNFKSERERL